MRMCFLEPTASVLGLSTYAAHNILEPLGLEYLAAFLESLGHSCEVVQQRCEPREMVLNRLVALGPQVLGISTQAYNIDDALWFAVEAKRRLPGLTVVLGGYHASAIPELVDEPGVDYVIMGEGEIPLSQLLEVLQGDRQISKVQGLAYRNGRLYTNARPPRIADLDSIPFPKRSREILHQCRMHGLMYPPPSQQTHVAMVTATRGCLYSCAFCCSELIWSRQIRSRSPCQVADELELLADTFDVNGVFFCDLTFNANKQYAVNLCEEIARRDVPIHFYAMCNLRGMDRELSEAMAAAKCAKIGFGVESFTDVVRLSVKDQGGMDLEHANEVLDIVADAGVLTKCYFIVGFPWETPATLRRLQEDMKVLRADEIKATFYVPFPGTRGHEMHKGLLTTTDWSKLTTLSEPVVRNENVSVDELKASRIALFDAFYNSPQWLDRVRQRTQRSSKYIVSFQEFTAFLRAQVILRLDDTRRA